MSVKEIISSRQVFLLIFFANIATTVFFAPGEITTIIGQEAWIGISLGTLLAAVLVYYPLADLGTRYPGQSIIQYSQAILGKIPGKVLGFLFLYYFFQLHCWTLSEFGEMFKPLMPETPKLVFMIAMTLIISYAVLKGLEVIARCAEFVFPIGFFFLSLILLLSIVGMNFSRLLPVFEHDLGKYLRASISPLDWLSLGFVFGIIRAC